MSVYKSKNSKNWLYDFQINGVRFHGSTGTPKKRAAEAIEAGKRTAAAEGQHFSKKSPMTLNEAAERYYKEVGEHKASSADIDYQLENLVTGFGKDRLLSELTDNEIAIYISRRRGQCARRRRDLVSPATVNREIELLRRIFRRATRTWKVAIGEMPDWQEHKLAEPDERVRSLSTSEETKLFNHLREDFRPLVEFALLTGVRLMNATRLTWSQVDFDAGVITFRVKSARPGGDVHELPITGPVGVLLAKQRRHHPIYVFTYLCQRSRASRRKGERYPYSKNGWRKSWKAALAAAKIDDFRFHDLRHTAATRTLRASGNLKIVQKMLGHSEIATTARYESRNARPNTL
jgi:integrase